MTMVCPVTNFNKSFPLHVALDDRIETTDFVMCERVKALDMLARSAVFKEKVPQDIIEEIIDIIYGFVELS